MPPEEVYGIRAVDIERHASLLKIKRRYVPRRRLIHPRFDAISVKVAPGVRRFWCLPHIEPPYPPVKAREPILDPSTFPQSKLVTRLAIQFSGLSLSDRPPPCGESLGVLERLPAEVVISIATNLAFWDKRALVSASRRIYHLLGSVEPPDRFSWRVHMLTSFNRAPSEFFDVTIFQSDDIRRELTRLVKQIPRMPKRGHYIFDPAKTRIKDLYCLYFPSGFHTTFRGRRTRCRTLGQFIAIQFNEYIARLLTEAKRGESQVITQRGLELGIDTILDNKTHLSTIAGRWREIYELWMLGKFCSKSKRQPLATLPDSAWKESVELLLRMGFYILHGRTCSNGQICEVGIDEGVKIRAMLRRKKRRLDCDADTDSNDGETRHYLSGEEESHGGGVGPRGENVIEAQEPNYFGDAMYFYGGEEVVYNTDA
ncbi:MAG: hypothetical protein Q9216_000713 [Gyalolechia sp. 2 TL-2023]